MFRSVPLLHVTLSQLRYIKLRYVVITSSSSSVESLMNGMSSPLTRSGPSASAIAGKLRVAVTRRLRSSAFRCSINSAIFLAVVGRERRGADNQEASRKKQGRRALFLLGLALQPRSELVMFLPSVVHIYG